MSLNDICIFFIKSILFANGIATLPDPANGVTTLPDPVNGVTTFFLFLKLNAHD